MPETETGRPAAAISADEVARAVAGQRSFVTQAVVTLLLYWLCFYIPGLIANIVWLSESGRVARERARAPAGRGCLQLLLIVGLLPWILIGVSCVAFAGAIRTSFNQAMQQEQPVGASQQASLPDREDPKKDTTVDQASELVVVQQPQTFAPHDAAERQAQACAMIRDLARASRFAAIVTAEQATLEATRKQQNEFNDMGLKMTFVCPETRRQFPIDWHKGKAEGNTIFDASAELTQRDIEEAKAMTLPLLKRHGLAHPREIPGKVEAAWGDLPSNVRRAYEAVSVSVANVGRRSLGNKTRFATENQFETETTETPQKETGAGRTTRQTGRTRTQGESVAENVQTTEFIALFRNHSPLAIKGLRARLVFVDNYGRIAGTTSFETVESIPGKGEKRFVLEVEDPVFSPISGAVSVDGANAKMREMQAILHRIDLLVMEDGTQIEPGLADFETPQEALILAPGP